MSTDKRDDELYSSKALYEALKTYWHVNPALDIDAILKKAEKHLYVIYQHDKFLREDLPKMHEDIAYYLDCRFIKEYKTFFLKWTNEEVVDLIKKNPKFIQGVELIKEALLSESLVQNE